MSQAELDVLAERQRQIFEEGFDEAHDEMYTHNELASAGACYAQPALRSIGWWPWPEEWWKPTTRRRDLVKAAALIIAQIDQMDRRGHE